MTQEVIDEVKKEETPEDQTKEVDTVDVAAEEEAEDAAMEAVFDDTPKNEPEDKPAEEKKEEPEEPTPTLIAGMTEDEIKEKLNKADDLEKRLKTLHDKFYGRIGDFEQRLKDIPQKVVSNISPKAREKMEEEFPELAEILFSDEEQEPVSENKTVDVNEIVSKAISVQNKVFEQRLMERDHPGFRETVKSDDFSKFVETLPEEEKHELNTSWDSVFLSKKLTEYKEWVTAKSTDDTEKAELEKAEADKAAKAASDKKKRLQSAITPRGDAAVNLDFQDDEEAGMLEGFNS